MLLKKRDVKVYYPSSLGLLLQFETSEKIEKQANVAFRPHDMDEHLIPAKGMIKLDNHCVSFSSTLQLFPWY